jgi:hypothetical protein
LSELTSLRDGGCRGGGDDGERKDESKGVHIVMSSRYLCT